MCPYPFFFKRNETITLAQSVLSVERSTDATDHTERAARRYVVMTIDAAQQPKNYVARAPSQPHIPRIISDVTRVASTGAAQLFRAVDILKACHTEYPCYHGRSDV